MTHFSSLTFRRVSLLAVLMIYLLIIMGGLVRTTGSGLGCPDWPLCHGQLLPPLEMHAIIEYMHRLTALGASIAAGAVTVMAFLQHRRHFRIAAPTAAMAGLLVLQIPLGGLVVVTELKPLLVAMHLGLALLIQGCLVVVAVSAHSLPEAPEGAPSDGSKQVRILVPVALIALFLLLLAGALVVSSEATFACMGWPLCSGKLLPGPEDSSLVAIQLLHRYMVAVVSVVIVALIVAILRGGNKSLRRWAILLGALFFAQVIIGAAQVWAKFPTVLRVAHLATAAAVWSTLVALAATAYLAWLTRSKSA
jgi:heme A synthase